MPTLWSDISPQSRITCDDVSRMIDGHKLEYPEKDWTLLRERYLRRISDGPELCLAALPAAGYLLPQGKWYRCENRAKAGCDGFCGQHSPHRLQNQPKVSRLGRPAAERRLTDVQDEIAVTKARLAELQRQEHVWRYKIAPR